MHQGRHIRTGSLPRSPGARRTSETWHLPSLCPPTRPATEPKGKSSLRSPRPIQPGARHGRGTFAGETDELSLDQTCPVNQICELCLKRRHRRYGPEPGPARSRKSKYNIESADTMRRWRRPKPSRVQGGSDDMSLRGQSRLFCKTVDLMRFNVTASLPSSPHPSPGPETRCALGASYAAWTNNRLFW